MRSSKADTSNETKFSIQVAVSLIDTTGIRLAQIQEFTGSGRWSRDLYQECQGSCCDYLKSSAKKRGGDCSIPMESGEKGVYTSYKRERLSASVSIGITEYIVGDTVKTILQRADNALYQAKERGRNQVVSISALRN